VPEPADCVVVGAGLAGLTCALRLTRVGRSVTVVEAGAVGGRARSRMVDGRPVDRGFQVLFSAYPATRRLLGDIGIGHDDLWRFSRSLALFDGSFTRLVTSNPRSLLRLPGVSPADVVRLGRVVAEAALRSGDALLDSHQGGQSTSDYLREQGVSPGAIDAFVRPLFGVIFLDRSLDTDAGYFRYLCHMLARGASVIPTEGLGQIAGRAAAVVAEADGEVRSGEAVVALEPPAAGGGLWGVRLSGGDRLECRSVVLAVEPPAARALLRPVDPQSAARIPEQVSSSQTAAYLLDMPLYRGRNIILNADASPTRGRVDLLCQTTNVTTPHAGPPHVLLATRVTTGSGGGDDLPDAVEKLVARLSPRFPWTSSARLVEVVDHPAAQWRPLPGVRDRLPGPETERRGLVLAGDCTTHPSIEGAVVSGERAAKAISDALSRRQHPVPGSGR
jgi:glycine/D-amino acid oxidase-like deaminating enzyme